MFDYLNYQTVDGTRKDREIEVYALSTCGFCKRALAFLDAEGFNYHFVHVDMIDFDLKTRAKKELAEKFNTPVSFPFAVIDGKTTLVGFIESDWRRVLLGA